jgi:hypothetical protein
VDVRLSNLGGFSSTTLDVYNIQSLSRNVSVYLSKQAMQRGDKSAAPAPSISSSAKSVARCFHDASKIATPPAQDPDVGLTRVEIDDSFTLYKLWGGNLGVFQAPTDTRSLDYRLRHEPEIRRRVLELLSSLEKLLRSGMLPTRCFSAQPAVFLDSSQHSSRSDLTCDTDRRDATNMKP